MTLGPKLADGTQSLILVSDNNFSATQFTQVLAFSLDLRETPVVVAKAETVDALRYDNPGDLTEGTDSDDPAVWLNPANGGQSIVITTGKNGGLRVNDLAGQELQRIAPPDIRYNNVDVLYNVSLDGKLVDIAVASDRANDTLAIFPHDICPVDGVVTDGRGAMDESFLTGEPFQMSKTPGSPVISGAINGESALTIRAIRPAADSRYAKIMEVMRESEAKRPQLRRLGDQLGAISTPVALSVAILAWVLSGESVRFLSVLVIATPCPLLLAIPIAIIGSISLCARRSIIVKSPVVLEQIAGCRTAISGVATRIASRLA